MALAQKLRHLLLLSTNVLLVLGCDSRTASKPTLQERPAVAVSPAVDSSRLEAVRDSLAILATASDTFRVNTGRIFRMEKVSKGQYDKALYSGKEKRFPADSEAVVAAEAAYLQAAAGRVWRRGDTLFFKTQLEKLVRLKDGPTYKDEEDSYEGYRFLDNLEAIQQWLVEVGKWEGRYYLLIDQQSGKRTNIISYPAISPDRHQFACANSDPTGYDLSGIQLWVKPLGAPPKLLWQRISSSTPGISAFGPRWENEEMLLFCEDFLIANRYMRIRL